MTKWTDNSISDIRKDWDEVVKSLKLRKLYFPDRFVVSKYLYEQLMRRLKERNDAPNEEI
jgi:hypothetical protein